MDHITQSKFDQFLKSDILSVIQSSYLGKECKCAQLDRLG